VRVLLLAALVLLAACAGGGREPSAQTPSPEDAADSPVSAIDWSAPVGAVSLVTAAPADTVDLTAALDVGLVIFDPGLLTAPGGELPRGVFPEIRRAEGRYLPVLLRQALVDSGAWGAVRVLPAAEFSAELLLETRILHSDGERLALEVQAVDATGRVWLDRVYTALARQAAYPVAPGGDPFDDLYRQIANDLLARRATLDHGELQAIRRVGLLRYAADLAPEAFGDYLARDGEGYWRVERLPAQGDPMLQRVQRLREQEYRFVDTVDEQYLELREAMQHTSDLWRQYGFEQAQYMEDYQRRLSQRDSAGSRGSFAAMQQTYNAFKWSKIQQQDLRELALGFNNEVSPTVLDVSGRVFRLSGSLDAQYAEWRAILRQIFALETGLPAGTREPEGGYTGGR
jgi:hypothetical protein